MRTGRPSIYKPEMAGSLLRWGKAGLYPVEWAAKLGISKKTLLNFREKHPEFLLAYDEAFTACEAFHMAKSRSAAVNGTGSPAMLKWLGSAVFGYRETTGVEHSGEIRSAPLDAEAARRAADEAEQAGEV